MIHELREYRVKHECRDEYLTVFEELMVPSIEQAGFTLLGAWITSIGDGLRSELTWLLQWDSLTHRDECNARYLASPAYLELDRRMGPMLVDARSRILKPTAFSPLQ